MRSSCHREPKCRAVPSRRSRRSAASAGPPPCVPGCPQQRKSGVHPSSLPTHFGTPEFVTCKSGRTPTHTQRHALTQMCGCFVRQNASSPRRQGWWAGSNHLHARQLRPHRVPQRQPHLQPPQPRARGQARQRGALQLELSGHVQHSQARAVLRERGGGHGQRAVLVADCGSGTGGRGGVGGIRCIPSNTRGQNWKARQ